MNAKSLVLPTILVALIPLGHFLARPAAEPGAAPPPSYQEPIRSKTPLNEAALGDLTALPGIGTKFAEQFLNARPAAGFQSWAEVDKISGVGPARLRQLQDAFELNSNPE